MEPGTGNTPDVLWAAQNGHPTLYRLLWNGSAWTPDTANGWSNGKGLTYPDGTGAPDAEGVTRGPFSGTAAYVATERNNQAGSVSRLSVLRYDTAAAGTTLAATHEWNLNADLPAVGANLGLEAIAFLPDAFLTQAGFRDERLASAYSPASYPANGGGLFVVGLESLATLHVYAFDHGGSAYQRVASFDSGLPGVMGLEYDPDTGCLYASCDDTCGNVLQQFVVDAQTGRFVLRRSFARPSTLPNLNLEGIALAPDAACSGSLRPFYWADDGATGGHSLRRDSLPCGAGW